MNHFLWVCSSLDQNLSNFVSPALKLNNPYCHSEEKVPTNWKSVFGGSAWQWDNKRKQYFLHQFYKEQPDLNLRNENVRKELRETLRFWLNLGVAGFRVDAVPHFFEDERYGNTGCGVFKRGVQN